MILSHTIQEKVKEAYKQGFKKLVKCNSKNGYLKDENGKEYVKGSSYEIFNIEKLTKHFVDSKATGYRPHHNEVIYLTGDYIKFNDFLRIKTAKSRKPPKEKVIKEEIHRDEYGIPGILEKTEDVKQAIKKEIWHEIISNDSSIPRLMLTSTKYMGVFQIYPDAKPDRRYVYLSFVHPDGDQKRKVGYGESAIEAYRNRL